MPVSDHSPQYVYRLATPEEWRNAELTGAVPMRDIDLKDGYVHLSTKAQALETARIHFSEAADLLALEISFAAIKDNVKFELAPKRGEAFPHLYGALKHEHVSAVIKLEKRNGEFIFGERR